MSDKFYAKSPGNEGYIKNMEVLTTNFPAAQQKIEELMAAAKQ